MLMVPLPPGSLAILLGALGFVFIWVGLVILIQPLPKPTVAGVLLVLLGFVELALAWIIGG